MYKVVERCYITLEKVQRFIESRGDAPKKLQIWSIKEKNVFTLLTNYY